jgi:hypothetical protein
MDWMGVTTMSNISQSPQRSGQQSVGMFLTREAAEAAYQSLQTAGFSTDRLFVDTQVLDPNPRLRDTKASRGAGGGAIAGTLFGGLVGALLVIISLNPATSTANPAATQPLLALVGMIFAAAGVGAVAGGLLGAFSGLNVPKTETGVDRDRLAHRYLVVLDGTEDERTRAKELLRQQGSQL